MEFANPVIGTTVPAPPNLAILQYIPVPVKNAPRKIAELICSKLDFEGNEFFERAEIAGPGFINFFLSRKFIAVQ